MERTFLVVVDEAKSYDAIPFSQSKSCLDSLSMAIGDLSTSISYKGNPLVSSSLAIRLSKSCNQNRPVYVANNLQCSDEQTADLYGIIFQFVRNNHKQIK